MFNVDVMKNEEVLVLADVRRPESRSVLVRRRRHLGRGQELVLVRRLVRALVLRLGRGREIALVGQHDHEIASVRRHGPKVAGSFVAPLYQESIVAIRSSRRKERAARDFAP